MIYVMCLKYVSVRSDFNDNDALLSRSPVFANLTLIVQKNFLLLIPLVAVITSLTLKY